MLRILIVASVLLSYTVASVAGYKGLYGYIGGGIGPQSVLYTEQERQIIYEFLFADYMKVNTKEMLMKKLSTGSKPQFNVGSQEQQSLRKQWVFNFWNEWDQIVTEPTASFRVGLGYRWRELIYIEGGYNVLYSQIHKRNIKNTSQEISRYFDQPYKHFLFHGGQIIGKGKIPLGNKWGFFVQLGGGLYAGTGDSFECCRVLTKDSALVEDIVSDKGEVLVSKQHAIEKLQIKRNQLFPLSPALITGGGFQYAFSSKQVLEFGWTHIRIQAVRPLNLLTINVLWL